jgi:predicted amidophosphoribosyltransferase
MGISVHECEPDVYIECDGCESDIKKGANIYCEKCATKGKKETASCSQCKHEFPTTEMFSKILGLMCHACAFRYEMKAMGIEPKVTL